MDDVNVYLIILIIISFTLFIGEHFTSKGLKKQLNLEYIERAKYQAFYYLNMEVAQSLERELAALQEKFEKLDFHATEVEKNIKDLSKNDLV